MKTLNKIYAVMALSAAFSLTSCIEETFPEGSTATAEQVGASATALEGSLNGIPAQMSLGYYVYEDQVHETDMAYPQFCIAQTEMLGDMYPLGSNSGYDWYRTYNTMSANCGETSYFAYLPWFTLYRFVKAANDVISTIDFESESTSDAIKGMGGAAYAMRAFDYYMLTVLFEPVENIYTDVSRVKGLTVPIVSENTTTEQAKSNPRVSHEEMMKFIHSDLDKAEQYLANWTPKDGHLPNLAVVYGIRAKVYLWDEDYANAAKYARMAIDASKASPVTADQWEDPTSGFCVANQAWMWYISYDAENMRNLANFTGWISGEADWGYSSLTRPSIDKSLFDKISDTDFRKTTFLHPDKYDYYDYKTCRDKQYIEDAPACLSLKFRCKGGDWENYATGGAVDVPIMRVEEMMLIEAEATAAAGNLAGGVALLNSFMQNYRDPNYNCKATDNLRDFQLEVLTQMRIEFWGEGNAFPSAKRIKPGVMQNYEGTNAPANIFKINCQGIKPIWNLVIPISELNNNKALQGWNNPNPTQTVTGPSAVGQYAPGNN
jgi:hypothetical protein